MVEHSPNVKRAWWKEEERRSAIGAVKNEPCQTATNKPNRVTTRHTSTTGTNGGSPKQASIAKPYSHEPRMLTNQRTHPPIWLSVAYLDAILMYVISNVKIPKGVCPAEI